MVGFWTSWNPGWFIFSFWKSNTSNQNRIFEDPLITKTHLEWEEPEFFSRFNVEHSFSSHVFFSFLISQGFPPIKFSNESLGWNPTEKPTEKPRIKRRNVPWKSNQIVIDQGEFKFHLGVSNGWDDSFPFEMVATFVHFPAKYSMMKNGSPLKNTSSAHKTHPNLHLLLGKFTHPKIPPRKMVDVYNSGPEMIRIFLQLLSGKLT